MQACLRKVANPHASRCALRSDTLHGISACGSHHRALRSTFNRHHCPMCCLCVLYGMCPTARKMTVQIRSGVYPPEGVSTLSSCRVVPVYPERPDGWRWTCYGREQSAFRLPGQRPTNMARFRSRANDGDVLHVAGNQASTLQAKCPRC